MTELTAPQLEAGMQAALRAARRWLGATYPNPPVGAAALDADGHIMAVAAHEKTGAAHAEAGLLALLRAQGRLAQAHTICVTLEPCNHYGRTPPCSRALIEAGIRHIAIGARDPNPIAGGGMEALQAAGVTVTAGIAASASRQLICAFAHSVTTDRPWLAIKRALDEQGSMIPPSGQKVFTSPDSLCLAHRWRKRADAILTGSGTILADRPLFTVRHVPDYPGRRRALALLDRRRRIPPDYLVKARARGFDPLLYDTLEEAVTGLAAYGCRDVLVEAGPAVSEAVLRSSFWCADLVIRKETPDVTTLRLHPGCGEQDWPLADFLPQEPDDA